MHSQRRKDTCQWLVHLCVNLCVCVCVCLEVNLCDACQKSLQRLEKQTWKTLELDRAGEAHS
jgi:hypothetical protein